MNAFLRVHAHALPPSRGAHLNLRHRSARFLTSTHTLRRAFQTSCPLRDAKPAPRGLATDANAGPAVPTTWIDRAPTRLRPYLYLTRIDKPIGTLLLFYPCGAPSVRVRALCVLTRARGPQRGPLRWRRTPCRHRGRRR